MWENPSAGTVFQELFAKINEMYERVETIRLPTGSLDEIVEAMCGTIGTSASTCPHDIIVIWEMPDLYNDAGNSLKKNRPVA